MNKEKLTAIARRFSGNRDFIDRDELVDMTILIRKEIDKETNTMTDRVVALYNAIEDRIIEIDKGSEVKEFYTCPECGIEHTGMSTTCEECR